MCLPMFSCHFPNIPFPIDHISALEHFEEHWLLIQCDKPMEFETKQNIPDNHVDQLFLLFLNSVFLQKYGKISLAT